MKKGGELGKVTFTGLRGGILSDDEDQEEEEERSVEEREEKGEMERLLSECGLTPPPSTSSTPSLTEPEESASSKGSFYWDTDNNLKCSVPGIADTFFQVPETFTVNYQLFWWKPGKNVRQKWWDILQSVKHLFTKESPMPKSSFKREEVKGRIFSLFQAQCRLMKLCYVDLQTSNKRSREILNNPLPTKVQRHEGPVRYRLWPFQEIRKTKRLWQEERRESEPKQVLRLWETRT